MSGFLYKVLWTLLHLLANLIESIYYFGLEFRENLHNFIENIGKSRLPQDDKQLLERHTTKLKKLPKHLAVILSVSCQKDVDLNKLTNLVIWALNSGVNFISFYDYEGIVKHELSSSFRKMIETINNSESEKIVWGPECQRADGVIKYPHRNGYKRHIVVNLYSSQDAHEKFNQLLTQELLGADKSEACNNENITVDLIEEKLSKLYGYFPDPDLGVYFGSFCCTQGFLPWQIRLTEFIQISYKLRSLSLQKYVNVLYKYAKCEQRFGQ